MSAHEPSRGIKVKPEAFAVPIGKVWYFVAGIAKVVDWQPVSALIRESKKKINIDESKDRAKQICDDVI